jgi:hypothetical protein
MRRLMTLMLAGLLASCAANQQRDAISKFEAIRIATEYAKVAPDGFEIDARFEDGEWLVLFDSKSDIIGDHFWVFVRSDGTVRRLMGGG